MNSQHDHGDIARAIIDANLYMVLATADAALCAALGAEGWLDEIQPM